MSVKKGTRYSIKSVIAITVSLLLIAGIAATLLIGNHFATRTEQAQKEKYISNIKGMDRNLNLSLSETHYTLKRLCDNDMVRSFLSQHFLNYNQMKNEWSQYLFENNNITAAVFIANDGEYQYFSKVDSLSRSILSEVVENSDNFDALGVVGTGKKSFVMAAPVYDYQYSEVIGKIALILSPDIFYDEFRFAKKEGFRSFIVVQDTLPINTALVTEYIKLPENWLSTVHEQKEGSFKAFQSEGKKYYSSWFFIENYKIAVCCVVPANVFDVEWPIYLWISIALLIVAIIVVFAMIIRLFVLMDDSFKSVDGLLGDIESFDKKRLEGLFSVEEFYYIADRVCDISDKIAKLNYEKLSAQKLTLQKEVAERQALLVAFKNQINPHFVYNTLACVKQLGVAGKTEAVSEICDRMVQILRYSVKNSSTAKVREELEALESYLFIQDLRFSHGILYKIDVDEQLLEYDMLRFLLQPIIENSIMHGILSESAAGKITISGKIEGEKMVFRISDSGVGMGQEALKALRQKLSKRVDVTKSVDDSGHGIGLVNINNRIKLYFGDEYGLKISSILNVGTFVTVEFPINAKKGGELDA